MAKTKISEYDSTAANNTDVDGVNLAEGCPPSGINNAIREVMAHLKDWQGGTSGDGFSSSGTITSSGTLAVTGNLTLDGASGTSGQFLTSAGTGATPTWTTLTAFSSGMLMMWATGTAPTGWLLCNGSAVSRTTYATLFGVIGTTFGSGDGSTTFNLPDLRNKMPIGAGSTYSVASTGGSADAIVVSHTHTASTNSAGSHRHLGNSYVFHGTGDNSGENAYRADGAQTSGKRWYTDYQGDHSHTVTVSSAGSSGTNANLPPYVGLYFIIKT